MNSILSINELPCLMLEKIFSFLPVFEIVRLMSVCKQWKTLIENTRKQLYIYHSSYPVNRFWFYPNQREVSDLDKVKVQLGSASGETVFSHPDTETGFLKFDFWKNIQKLAIYSTLSDHCYLILTRSFNLWLNSLHQLNELSLYKVVLSTTFTKIELQNLKLLTLDKIWVEGNFPLVLSLETPLLEHISFHPLHEHTVFFIRLLYPEAVKSVRCFRFDETFEMCINLEHLSFEKIRKPFDLLVRCPNLKLIEALPSCDVDVLYIQLLRSQMQRLHRRSLQLVVSGSLSGPMFCFPRNEDPFKLGFLLPFGVDKKNVRKFSRHLQRMVRPVPVALGLYDYSNAVKAFGGRLPNNFITLFPKIREIVASQVVDHQGLFDLLADCRSLRKLELFYCEFSTQFYRRLTNLKPLLDSLEWLMIYETQIKINFGFLVRMKNLKTFWLCVAKRRPPGEAHLQMIVDRDENVSYCPKVFRLHVFNYRLNVFDFQGQDQPPEHLESLIARLHQHKGVQRILG